MLPPIHALKLTESVSIRDFGAQGNGGDDSAAIQAAADYATTNKLSLLIPDGTYTCASKISVGSTAIRGNSHVSSKIVFTNPNGGFVASLSTAQPNVPAQQLLVSDLTLEAGTDVKYPAIGVTYDKWQPNGNGNVWVQNVVIQRSSNGTGSFTKGIALKNVFGARIEDTVIVGDDARKGLHGIYAENCIVVIVQNTDVLYNQTAIGGFASADTPQCEGIVIQNCNLYNNGRGIDIDKAIAVMVRGTHLSNDQDAIAFTNINQSFIDGCLIYVGGTSASRGIVISGGGGTQVSNNQVWGLNGKCSCGIELVNTVGTLLTGNVVAAAVVGISSDVNCLGTILQNNNMAACQNPINLRGTKEYDSGNTVDSAPRSLRVGIGGSFVAGSLYSDSNWGMILRAAQSNPVMAEFLWTRANGDRLMQLSKENILSVAGVQAAHRSADGTAGITATKTFFAAPSKGSAATQQHVVTVKDGIITSWTQS